MGELSVIYKHILVAIDLGVDSAKVALRGAALARAYGAKLSFVMVEPGIGDSSLEEIELGLDLSARIQPKRQQMMAEFISDNVDYPVTGQWLMSGEMNRQVNKVITATEADLLVAGKHMDHRWFTQHTGQSLAGHVISDLLLVTLETS
ncbi:hypothetical protein DU002_03940 [Corallincola holothuriorum]|uniref:Universal stress protein n=1 Tax=Corallincola holothuriorum TaxID=2282215 RepID=A0A368NNF5_9GAMM|nr:hypothetical protein DU002_03940 [Corallincola holothuriorum]